MAAQGAIGAPIETQISVAQFGIVMSGLVSIAAGFVVKRFGKDTIDKILPASVTGSVAMVIGLTLVSVALGDASTAPGITGASDWAWVISLVTLLCTVIYSVYLKGFWKQISLLLGLLTGCVAAAIAGGISGISFFRDFGASGGIFALPRFSLPIPSWAAIVAIMPIAIATIPESTAHIYQLDIYVNHLAKSKNKGNYPIAEKLGLNLIGDGLGDMVAGFIGGPAGTNYGENISAMAITKVFSIPVLIVAAIIAMVISCFTPLINAIYAIPTAVLGGMEMYLFGAIAAQGIAIMLEKKTDMFSAKNIAIIASIMTIGVGGQYAFGGSIPFFGIQVPCIAGAAIFGILLNLILSGAKKENDITV